MPALEHKLWWDEAYDCAFYRPAVLLATGLYRFVERPIVEGSIPGVALELPRPRPRRARRSRPGFVRSYALALAVGLTVLAVVFISVR